MLKLYGRRKIIINHKEVLIVTEVSKNQMNHNNMVIYKKKYKKKYYKKKYYKKKYKIIYIQICKLYIQYFVINLHNIFYKNYNYNHKIYIILYKTNIKIYR